MSNVINSTCLGCDYKDQCNRTFEYKDETYVAKEQEFLIMKCQNIVQDICRDCILFREKRCASWMILNGKVHNLNVLEVCPKKEPIEGFYNE